MSCMYVCMYVKGLLQGENGKFGYICVIEKSGFELLIQGCEDGMGGGGVSGERAKRIPGGERVEGCAYTPG